MKNLISGLSMQLTLKMSTWIATKMPVQKQASCGNAPTVVPTLNYPKTAFTNASSGVTPPSEVTR